MKRNTRTLMFLIAIFCLVYCHAKAQNGMGDFFNQQQSKFKIMLQQIASLEQQYITLKKGYNQTAGGLNSAQQIKNGTFSFHRDYYNSLYAVPPAVRDDPKVKAMIALQQDIITFFDNAIAWHSRQGLLTSEETDYIRSVYGALIKDCQQNLDELKLVVTPGQMQMKDAERVKKIDQLYQDTQKQSAFTNSFLGQCYALADMRAIQKADGDTMGKIYQTNP